MTMRPWALRPSIRTKTNTDDEAMGVESAQKKHMETDATALDADGEAEHGESQEEVVVPKESDVSSRADGENNTMAVPPLALPSASAQAPTLPPGNNCPTPECMKLLGPLLDSASDCAESSSVSVRDTKYEGAPISTETSAVSVGDTMNETYFNWRARIKPQKPE